MDYAGNPRREDIDKPVEPLETRRPDVRCPSGMPSPEPHAVDGFVPRGAGTGAARVVVRIIGTARSPCADNIIIYYIYV
jgi:hypothetical protein